jgi:elongation factor Ts
MDISAKQVMQLRQATGLGMMDCKKALIEVEGDFEKAQEVLRKKLGKKAESKVGREAKEGRSEVRLDDDGKAGTLLIVTCESEPVKGTDMFKSFVTRVADLAQTSGVKTIDELLATAWEGDEGDTVEEARKIVSGTLGENMQVKLARLAVDGDGTIGTYIHHDGKIAAMVALAGEGDLSGAAKDLCMHITFARPTTKSRDDISKEEIEKELVFLREQVSEDPKMQGKPEAAVEGIVQGRLAKNFFGERVLLEQPWFRDAKSTVTKELEAAGAELIDFALFGV